MAVTLAGRRLRPLVFTPRLELGVAAVLSADPKLGFSPLFPLSRGVSP